MAVSQSIVLNSSASKASDNFFNFCNSPKKKNICISFQYQTLRYGFWQASPSWWCSLS